MISRPPPVTDSPLFWLLLFGSAGLLMLTAVEPKYIKRQERIVRMQESRERARPAGSEAVDDGQKAGRMTPLWQPTEQATLRPLMLFLACVLFVAMIVMQVRRQRAIARYRQAQAALKEGGRA
jgi:hypothetical protein